LEAHDVGEGDLFGQRVSVHHVGFTIGGKHVTILPERTPIMVSTKWRTGIQVDGNVACLTFDDGTTLNRYPMALKSAQAFAESILECPSSSKTATAPTGNGPKNPRRGSK